MLVEVVEVVYTTGIHSFNLTTSSMVWHYSFKVLWFLRLMEIVADSSDLIVSVNVLPGPIEDRMMTTGLHTVCDIYCRACHQIVGWKYVSDENF